MSTRGRPFQPGQSGNPGGQHKATKELRKYAQQFTEEAIDSLVEIARDKNAPPKARIEAWNSVLDRGHGKPTQAVEVTGEDGGPLKTVSIVSTDPIEAAKEYQRIMGE